MSLPGFSALASGWLFLLLVPLIIFYFLKLKRPRMEVPSLALWRQVMNDQRVNSPFQRFKRNLLLLLQVLLLVCLVLAAMQPFWPSGADRAKYLPVLIDSSASMAALDRPGGRSRLDVAKDEVRKLIDNLLPDQRLALISVTSTARRLTDFTDNKRVLRDALDQLTASQLPSRLEDGLRMAQAMARTVPVEKVAMYTDGNLPPRVDFDLPFQLSYQRLPPAGPNAGITALNARRTSDTAWEVFVRVTASGGAEPAAANKAAPKTPEKPTQPTPPISATVAVLQDGKPAGEETVQLAPGQSQRLTFSLTAANASALEVRLVPDVFDSLAADNTAYLDLPVGRPLLTYCSPRLAAYRHALRHLKQVSVVPTTRERGTAPSYDLVIADSPAEAQLESLTTLQVGVIPEDLAKLVSVKRGWPKSSTGSGARLSCSTCNWGTCRSRTRRSSRRGCGRTISRTWGTRSSPTDGRVRCCSGRTTGGRWLSRSLPHRSLDAPLPRGFSHPDQ